MTAMGFRWIDMGRWSVVWIVSDGIKDEIRVLQGFDFWVRGLDGGGSASEPPSTMGSKVFCGPSADCKAGGWPLSFSAFRAEESRSDFCFKSEPFCEWDRKEERERDDGRRVARKDLLEVILG